MPTPVTSASFKSNPNSPLPPTTVLECHDDLLKTHIVGECPDDVIQCEPRWLVFYSNYKQPCYAEFTITNKDDHKIAWCIKAKEKLMKLSQTHGILKSGETRKLTVYLPPSDDWPRDISDYNGKRLKMVVENLKIPDNVQPKSELESRRMSREIFLYTAKNNPLIRQFTKVNIVLQQ
ncbi:hypothetical protein V3C99_012504 [Haemonchus contortus]|uniref:Major sperm protein n=1 Tax=Haemonchus contortus TaxID=6289 RepID=A0A7I4Y555_HAECO|nr:Protein DCT-9 [Haemonchus contortus]